MGVKMEKVIIRSKKSAHPSSNYVNRHYKKEATKNIDALLAIVYDDNESYEKLINEYNNIINGGNSSLFLCAYLLKNGYAVVLDSHITLYKLCMRSEEDEGKILWSYYSSSKYLGDTWWFSDNEILMDLSSLSIVDFLLKYKGL